MDVTTENLKKSTGIIRRHDVNTLGLHGTFEKAHIHQSRKMPLNDDTPLLDITETFHPFILA